MTPFLQQPTASTQDDYDIRILDGSQPMCNHKHSSSFRCALNGRLNGSLAFRIERTSGLIEHEYLGVADECTGNKNTLLLPAGERDTAGTDVRVISLGKGHDEIMN